jgi:hypothetical protein
VSPEERAALQREADQITAEIRAIDEKFFYERDVLKRNLKPVDPAKARVRLQRRRDIEKLLEDCK